MRGLTTGLDVAWKLGCRKVVAFTDSQAALDLFLISIILIKRKFLVSANSYLVIGR
ncbi:hypothetical protein LINGRAHAP2_LOCUS12881 [Linum grandiflorum]